MSSPVSALRLDRDEFVKLMYKLIGETEKLQNNPPEYVPTEDLAGRHVLDILTPLSEENGGRLRIQHVHFAEVRAVAVRPVARRAGAPAPRGG